MKKYQVIEIVNEEPLKIGSGGNKSTSEPCQDYIPGSTLRGGIIALLLKSGISSDQNLTPVLQQMICYNAYPYERALKRLYTPTPQQIRVDKHEWRMANAERQISDVNEARMIPLTNLMASQENKAKNKLPYRLVAIGTNGIVGKTVSKSYQLHHSKSLNKDKQEKENLYYYQAIAPGHVFRTILMYHSEIAPQIKKLLSQTGQIYLGGSKGSGYGRCSIKVIDTPTESYEEAKRLLGVGTIAEKQPPLHSLLVTCLSDCMFRDNQGMPTNELPPRLIRELTNGDFQLELVNQYVNTGLTEGFNMKWHARYPKEATLAAGSTLKYVIHGNITSEQRAKLVQKLEQQPHGLRIQDGYGWLAADLLFPEQLEMTAEPLGDKQNDTREENQQIYTADEQQVIEIISNGLRETKERWLRLICERALEAGDIRLSQTLKPHHLRNMRVVLTKWLDARSDQTQGENGLLGRPYESNNKLCSIKDTNFEAIIRYLEYPETGKEHVLSSYAACKLSSRSGLLFYEDASDLKCRQRFIAEMLNTALYLAERKGGPRND